MNARPLILFSWLVMIFGAFLCLGGFVATLLPVDLFFKIYHPGEAHTDWDQHMRLATGLMGAVTLGWGLTLLAISKHSPAMGAAAKAVWGSITIGMLIWYVVDNIISVANGFWVNAISNTVIAVIYLLAIRASGVRQL